MRRATVVAFAVIALAHYGAAVAGEPSQPRLMPQDGTYLEDHYLEVLRRTHSPVEAANGGLQAGIAQEVVVRRNLPSDSQRGLVFGLVWNWHEAATFIMANDGALHFDPIGANNLQGQVEVPDPTHFRLRLFCKESSDCVAIPGYAEARGYTSAGDERRLLNSLTLQGRYRDENGRLYRFSDDGQADLDGKPATYEIINDPVWTRSDFARFNGTGRIPGADRDEVAYRRDGETLTWYASTAGSGDSAGDADYSRPLVTMRRLSD